MRRRRRSSGGLVSRRKLLLGVGAGLTGAGLTPTGAYSSVDASRGVSVSVVDGSNALVGIVGQGPVKKKTRSAMVEFTNNTNSQLSITVTLTNCTDGTLYDNVGGSGCSVTFTLATGNSQFVDITADVTGTIPYSINASSPEFDLDTTGSVQSESGNTATAIRVKKPNKNQDFDAVAGGNFELDAVDVIDDDGDDDLDLVEFRVRESGSGGTIVGSMDVTNPPGDQYNPQGTGNAPAVSITPDSGYTITAGTTYSLTVTAYDVDGNHSSETVDDTA